MRHFAAQILVALVIVGCGGGGGSAPQPIDPSSANDVTNALDVKIGRISATKLPGTPPVQNPSTAANAPVVSVDATTVQVNNKAGSQFNISIRFDATSAAQAIFAKVVGASSYFQFGTPPAQEKSTPVGTQTFIIALQLLDEFQAGQFCIEFSGSDVGLVSNVKTVCVVLLPETQLQQAKNLVQNIRNTVQTQQQLRDPAVAFGNQVNATALLTQTQAPSLFGSLQEAVTEAARFYSAQQGAAGSEPYNTLDDASAPRSATITVTDQDGGTSRVQIVGNVRNETINLSVDFTKNPPDASTNAVQGAIAQGSMIATTSNSAGLKLVINNGSAVVNKSDSNPIAANYSNVSSGSVNVNATLSQQNLPSADTAVSFTGSLVASAVRCTAQTCQDALARGSNARFTPSNFTLDGIFMQGSSTVESRLSAMLDNPGSFDPHTEISSGNVPAGNAEFTVSENNIPNLPPTTVDIKLDLTSFYNSSTCCDRAPIGTATLTFTQSGVKLLIATITTTAPASGAGQANVKADFTDDNGTTLTLTDPFSGSASGDIGQATVNGAVVGTVRKLNSGVVIIAYTDGTFESLFN